MEKVKDKNKKGIIQLYLRYVKKKMIEYLKTKGDKNDIEKEIENKEEENIFENNLVIDLLSIIYPHSLVSLRVLTYLFYTSQLQVG